MSRRPLPPPSDLELLFAARVRALREFTGCTQGELAAKAGMAQDQVSKIERGGQRVHLFYAEKLAAALGRTLPELLSTDPLPVEI